MSPWLFSAAFAAPVEVAPGVTYEAGAEIGVASLGVSMTVPAGWRGQLAPSGEALVLGSTTVPGLLLVMVEPATLDQAKAAMAEPVVLDPTATLVPTGAPVVDGRRVRASYRVPQQPGMAGRGLAVVGEHGAGVALLAAGPEAQGDAYVALLDGVAGTLKFGPPSAPAPAAAPAPATSSGPWATSLRGRRLHYLYTNNGFSDEWKLDLCADGTFRYRTSSSSSSFQTGSLSMSGRDGGVWTVAGDRIHLVYADGSTEDATLSGGGRAVYWSGTKTWVEDAVDCP